MLPNIEELDLLTQLNGTLLQAKKSPFYASKLKGVKILESFDQITSLPFTTKEDLRSAYPDKNLCVGMENCIVIHASSGTTGKPTLSYFTEQDIDRGNQAIAGAWKTFGVSPESRVQFAMSYGLFSGAALNTRALHHIGAFVLPAGIITVQKQVEYLIDFKIDTLVATPGFYFHLYEYMKQNHISIKKLSLIRGIAAGESYSESTRKKIQDLFGIKIFDHYGLAEINTGIAYECALQNGFHYLDTYIHPEVINPETLKPVSIGETGELILTTLQKEASPVIRYRTNDRTTLLDSACPCGRKTFRTSRMQGRIDQVISVKGIKINPEEVRQLVLNNLDGRGIESLISIRIKQNSIDFDPILLLYLENPSEAIAKSLELSLRRETMIRFKVQFAERSHWENEIAKRKLIEYYE